MNGDFIFMQILAVCASAQDGELLRQGATLASLPIDFTCVSATAAARAALSKDQIDIVFVDHALAEQDCDFIGAARAARQPPFVVLVAPTREEAADLAAAGAAADGVVARPGRLVDAKALIEGCVALKVPSRVLVVDDSSTMRNIVRKILTSCRFPLEVSEAGEGVEALKQIGTDAFDLVLLDYNMPGLNGLEMLVEIKRQYPRLGVVLMTSAQDEALAARARAAGAAAFLKKPFYAADIDAVLYAWRGLRPPAPARR
jgi:CheY-like chemotaxis protein